MRYVPKLDLLVLHVPKCAGVSLEDAIDQRFRRPRKRWGRHKPTNRHVEPADLMDELEWPPALTFVAVREPVAWYASAFRWIWKIVEKRRQLGRRLRSYKYKYAGKPAIVPLVPLFWLLEPEFERWIDGVAAWRPGFYGELLGRYVPVADYVARVETLEADARRAIDAKIRVPRSNSSEQRLRIPEVRVTPAAADKIAEIERAVLDRYYGPETIDYRWKEDWR